MINSFWLGIIIGVAVTLYFVGISGMEMRRRWQEAQNLRDYLTVVFWPFAFIIELVREVKGG